MKTENAKDFPELSWIERGPGDALMKRLRLMRPEIGSASYWETSPAMRINRRNLYTDLARYRTDAGSRRPTQRSVELS